MAVKIATPECTVCGKHSVVEVTEQEFDNLQNGALLIQDALPDRDAGFRELLKSGIHSSCWDSMFPDEDFGDGVEIPFPEAGDETPF